MGICHAIKIRKNRRQNAGNISLRLTLTLKYICNCVEIRQNLDTPKWCLWLTPSLGVGGDGKRWEGENLLKATGWNVLTKKGIILLLLLNSDGLEPCINQNCHYNSTVIAANGCLAQENDRAEEMESSSLWVALGSKIFTVNPSWVKNSTHSSHLLTIPGPGEA